MSNKNNSDSTSRRSMLRASVAAATLLGLGMGTAQAAKASKGSVGYRDSPNGEIEKLREPAACLSRQTPASQ